MKSLAFLACLSLSPSLLHAAADPLGAPIQPEWRPLFNGRDLSGWDTFIATSDGGADLVPNVDSGRVFSVIEQNGEPVIRVSGEEFGALTTREDFGNMHFRVQFKWGLNRFGGRATVGRDTGILYCATGRPNPGTGWMTSVENNIMEKGVGQWWSVNGALIDCEGEWITEANELSIPYKKEGAGEKNIVWKKGAPRVAVTAGNGITPPFDVEQVFGNWNTVEVVFWAGQCFHILNGHVNLVAVNPRHQVNGRWQPLLRGRIQLQSELAEVYFRGPEVRAIKEVPEPLLESMVSPAGDDEGFTDLFREAALADWKQAGPGSFVVDQGIATPEGGMGLWWYSGATYGDFVLRGEFMQDQEAADSGVFLRFPDPGQDPAIAIQQGHEVEIGDPNPKEPTWRTGSIYPFKASREAGTHPPGQWNAIEIVAIGHDYSVRINGRIVTTWSDPDHRSLHGHLGLQNYNDGKSVQWRALRVKELWPGTAIRRN